MKKELVLLREKMKAYGFDAYIVPTSDFHQSEYVHDYFKCREFVSGFTGSAGTLVVTMDDACLWTDGRYFLQAEQQLEGSGIRLMKMGQVGVPTVAEYLETALNSHTGRKTLAFDGRVCTLKDISEDRFNTVTGCDLVGEIWRDRPVITPSKVYALDESVIGESHVSKLARLRAAMAEKQADYHIMTNLDEIAWLYNLRGNDVNHTPVFFAYALITPEDNRLYVMDQSLLEDAKTAHHGMKTHLENVTLHRYAEFLEDVKNLPSGILLLDRENTSYAILHTLPDDVEIISCENPVATLKAIKNEIEIASTKKAHLKDGAAMVEFLCWLKTEMEKQVAEQQNSRRCNQYPAACDYDDAFAPITELSASAKLENFRKQQPGFCDLSFETISAYGSNGAIIHYSATEATNKVLEPEGFYLVDSGGQYQDGTTDITRTVALGPLTHDMKLHYTTVLKCHIALCTAQFAPGTTGAELDTLTRTPLHKIGLDYNHGTGHGVGHLLGCHEGPQSISKRDTTHAIVPGMINSDEPGVYIEGDYGIRLENEILCVEMKDGRYGFEPITFCPFEKDAILPELLTADELVWLNDYHRQVREKISPLVSDEAREWLKDAAGEFSL